MPTILVADDDGNIRDRAHTRKYSGSGMGLAIVKQIVTLHHGDIQVDSELGQGTAMTVILPLAGPVDHPPSSIGRQL